ncbi:MAG: hypothetical protein AAGH78_09105 [Cyanobacteria bacterium P01_H01_bin.58]
MKQFPFHNNGTPPLPDANDIERAWLGDQEHVDLQQYGEEMNDTRRQRLEEDKRILRNFLIKLLVTGFAIGGLLSVGLVWTMNRLNLTPQPTLQQPLGD